MATIRYGVLLISYAYGLRTPAEIGCTEVSRTGSLAAPLRDRWLDASDGVVHPTNAWWENLVLCDGSPDPVSGMARYIECNVFLIPYVVWPSLTGLQFAVPYRQEQGANVANMFDDTLAVRLYLGTTTQARSQHVRGWREDGYDDLTIRLAWPDAGVASTLARGSPFLTVEFKDGSVPLFASPQRARAIRAMDFFGAAVAETACEGAECDGAVLEGTKFTIVLAQSDETWLLYAYPAAPSGTGSGYA